MNFYWDPEWDYTVTPFWPETDESSFSRYIKVSFSADEEFVRLLAKDAKERGVTLGSHLNEILQDFYVNNGIDYMKALDRLIAEAEEHPHSIPFALMDLSSFRRMKEASFTSLKSARSRIGTLFADAVRDGRVTGVKRHLKEDGTPAYRRRRDVLYIREVLDPAPLTSEKGISNGKSLETDSMA